MKLVQSSSRNVALECNCREKRLRTVVCWFFAALLSPVSISSFAQTDPIVQGKQSEDTHWQLSSKERDLASNDGKLSDKDAILSSNKPNLDETPDAPPNVTLDFDVSVSESEELKGARQAESQARELNKQTANDGDINAQSKPERAFSPDQTITENSVSAVPLVDLTPEFRESLERQFIQIQKMEEQEDAFSENLGEAYLGYGKLLAQAGRLDEARDMYAKSLHLAKINNGVYAIEQRPVLRAMFEMYEAKQDVEAMERNVRQVMWLEKKHPTISDAYSFDMVVSLGNMLIDQYYAEPRLTEAAVVRVDKATHFFNYAINRYGDVPLSERAMPYGELALLQYIKSKINQEFDRSSYEHSRRKTFEDINRGLRPQPRPRSGHNYLGNAAFHLNKYLHKAQLEGDIEHQVRALRDLGDLFLLFNRGKQAARHYNEAWVLAAGLDEGHELVTGFDQPAKLPDFRYSIVRERITQSDKVVEVPLSFNIDEYGRVGKIHTDAADAAYPKLVFRAKRASKRLKFRPIIENGKMIATDNFNYEVRVKLRYGETVAQAENL